MKKMHKLVPAGDLFGKYATVPMCGVHARECNYTATVESKKVTCKDCLKRMAKRK